MSSWFPSGRNNTPGWRLDIVSLLAVIGEASMAEQAQALTASWLCVLPRIIPAPQALLKSSRPTRMPSLNASIIGVYNGVLVTQLNCFPNFMHPIEELRSMAFRVYEIKHREDVGDFEAGKAGRAGRGEKVRERKRDGDVEARAVPQSDVFPHTKRSDTRLSIPSILHTRAAPQISARLASPLHILTILSFLGTIGLLVWSILIHDGVACVALGTISLASSTIGLASKWSAKLTSRSSKVRVPNGTVVIRTREGAFVVVKCSEEVARELYNGTEECRYFVGDRGYRALVGLGTFLLMVSVVLLGNCNWTMQLVIGASYILLNGLFWLVALMPRALSWNLSPYVVANLTPNDMVAEDQRTFTHCLWYAIRETRTTGWVEKSGAVPKTDQWAEWLREARVHICTRDWDAVGEKDAIMGRWQDPDAADGEDDVDVVGEEGPKNHVPAVEIPPESRK